MNIILLNKTCEYRNHPFAMELMFCYNPKSIVKIPQTNKKEKTDECMYRIRIIISVTQFLTSLPSLSFGHKRVRWMSWASWSSAAGPVSLLLPPLPVLPATQILEGSSRRVRCHQAISHPLVHQGGVRGYGTQQHGKASVQHVPYAARQRGGSC